ncbi:pyruvate formate lyase family protein [Butyrivibrio fibrisolvens]|uniref:Formate C-acetyltransferase n=1 Tax=Butyrivibrio fibrisolvens TaxID=831 RepID=A0A317G0D6_BUTFI|nr:pyruvate formate lyase family protein [Butyrivibrio fibrisolvens]PWT26033.1 hypothetical protein CPT75_02330 [Butyrivibrio fibrisolvens]
MDNKLKKIIKNTYFFQFMKMKKYVTMRSSNYKNLKSNEDPKRYLLCRNTGTTQKTKVNQLEYMLKNINIQIEFNNRFQVWIDSGLYVYQHYPITDNTPPDYSIVINNSLDDMKKKYLGSDDFSKQQYRFLNYLSEYLNRIIVYIDLLITKEDSNESVEYLKNTRNIFARMKNQKAETLEEGLQRILFWSSLFWQTQHRLVGLGRLDKILDNLLIPESENEVIDIIKDFNLAIHKYYAFKSNDLMGDTGQIIVLGGIKSDGSYFSNRLTYLFIKAAIEQQIPDPKLLLRVSEKMPDNLIELAITCISKGMGYPLLANDDRIIPSIEMVYGKKDSYDYVTSACWEPLVYGKSLDKNNLDALNFAAAFVTTYLNEHFIECRDLEDLKKLYLNSLGKEIQKVKNNVSLINWEPDPLNSLFISDCIEKRKDVSQGGAKYNNYGVLGVGLGNTINSILIISDLVFEKHRYSLAELRNACINNFDNNEQMLQELSQADFYGIDNEMSINLTREIVDYTYNHLKDYRNRFGGKLKFGLSASNYKELGNVTPATMDGRRNGDPLGVHISSHGCDAYTSLVNFAGELDYSDIRCNGNVVDFFVSPAMIKDNFDKFILFIKSAIKVGFFQMQMNVVDSRTLIDARKYPDKYPNLIVRVWGFSSYFNDLPDDYKDLLIKRAMQSEGMM